MEVTSVPLGQEYGGASLASLSWLLGLWQNQQVLGLVHPSVKLRESRWLCGVERQRVHTAVLRSPLLRSGAGTALPCGSASHTPDACLWDRQDGPRALEESASQTPNFEALALSAPTSNTLERNQIIKGEGDLFFCSPHCLFTPILFPNEILTPWPGSAVLGGCWHRCLWHVPSALLSSSRHRLPFGPHSLTQPLPSPGLGH